jgi:hypothetical protein
MKTLAASLLLLVGLCALAQAQDDIERVKIEFKSGEVKEAVLKDVTEQGVTLIGDDGSTLFIKWSYTRGDKLFDLRKRACNYKSLSSIVALADFCHDFALDRKEAETLVEALKIAPTDEKLKARLAALPKFDDIKPPVEKPPEPKPVPKPEPKPEPEPGPAPGGVKVLKIECNEADLVPVLARALEKYGYKQAEGAEFDVTVKVTAELTLVKNPKWMGAELYAIYDGTAKYQLMAKGEKSSFDDRTVEAKNVRSNKDKVEGKKMCIDELVDKLKDPIHNALRKRSK